MSIRNISIVVDALALASGEQPDRAVFLVDDCPESTGRGTLGLESVVAPGDLVRWNVIPIDLQAPAFIRDLRFPGPTGDGPGVDDHPTETPSAPTASDAEAGADTAEPAGEPVIPGRARIWEGIVPFIGPGERRAPYALELAFSDLHAVTIRVDGPALRVHAPGSPPPPPPPPGSLLAADDVL